MAPSSEKVFNIPLRSTTVALAGSSHVRFMVVIRLVFSEWNTFVQATHVSLWFILHPVPWYLVKVFAGGNTRIYSGTVTYKMLRYRVGLRGTAEPVESHELIVDGKANQ